MPDALFGLVAREVARRGGGQSELFLCRERARRYDARGGGIDSLSVSDALFLGVRVFRNGRMGFSYGFRADEEEIARMVETAVFCADSSDPDPACGLPDAAGDVPGLSLFDPSWERIGDAEKAEFAAALERATLAFDPRIKRVRSASLRETVTEAHIRNSEGRSGAERASRYFAFVTSVAEQGDEGQTGYGFGFSRRFSDLRIGAIAEEAGRNAVRMLGASRPGTGRCPAILENGAAAELLEVLVPSFYASQVAKGKSLFAGKAGAQVASGKIRIADDPLDPEGSGAAAFDGEGTPSRKNVLVEAGTLRRFLSDSFWGRKTGTGTTGSCRRQGPKTPPAVGISNFLIAPGAKTPEGLRRDMGSGILLTEFMGIHTADPVSGDFSVGAAGIRVKGGEEKEPVRGFAVSGNVLSLLSSVSDAGSDFRWFGNIGSPSLAVPEITVGGE